MADLRTLVYKVEMNVDGAKKGARSMQVTMKTMEQDTKKADASMQALADSIGKKYNVQAKILIDNTKSAKAELQALNKESNRNAQNFNRLTRDYTRLAAATGRTANEQEQLNALYRLGSGATLTQKKQTLALVKAYQLQREAANKTQGSMRGLRGQMQNIGFQAQDIAVQMQMGTNAMVIFSQQGSQLAAGFGPTGALIGAGIAFAGMLGSVLMPSLMKSGDEVDKLNEKFETLARTTGISALKARSLIKAEKERNKERFESIAKIQNEINAYENSIETYEEYEKRKLREITSMDAVNGRITVSVKNQKDWQKEQKKSAQANMDNHSTLENLNDEFEESRKRINLYITAIGDKGTDTLEKWKDSNADIVKGLSDQVKVLGKSRVEVLQLEKQQALLTLTNQNATTTQKKQVELDYEQLILAEQKAQAIKDQAAANKAFWDSEKKKQAILNRVGSDKQRLEIRKVQLADELALFHDNIDAQKRILEEFEKDKLRISGTAFEKYMVNVEDQLSNFDEIVADSLDRFTSGFGQAVSNAVFESDTLGEALKNIFTDVAKNMVAFFAEWAAQEAVLWALRQFFQKTAAVSGATTAIATAQVTSLQAGLAAFASTAAIPIYGPTLAPAAFAGAVAATQPVVAAIGSIAFAGAFDKGGVIPQNSLGIIAEYGDELANGMLVRGGQGGTRITGREDTQKLMTSNRGGDVFNINGANASADQIARALVRKMKRGDKQLDNAIFDSSNRGRRNGGKRYAS